MASINASTSGAGGIITTADNTGTLQLQSGGTTIMTIGSTGVTMQVGAPAFSAYVSTNQALTQNAWTKIQANTEEWDTNSNYDSTTNYRFTPTVAGYYQVTGNVETQSPSSLALTIYKNGSEYKRGANLTTGSATAYISAPIVSAIVYLNGSTDYIEMYAYTNNTGTAGTLIGNANYRNYFQAAMIRSA